jgi:hypothetical protein
MEWLVIVAVLVLILFLLYRWNQYSVLKRRERLIDTYVFPDSISVKVNEKYPHLTHKDLALVMSALRDYFHVCNVAGEKMVSMPSQVVDVAWHEFILFTKKYDYFCKKALGRFLHHTPAEAMKKPTLAQIGIKTAWRVSCHRAGINHKAPSKLPVLFAIDSILKIEDGFKYSLNCTKKSGGEFCVTHIGCGSGCAGGSAFGNSEGGVDSSGCSSGCGGGCGSS